MTQTAAVITLAFNVGVMLGIGVATAQWSLIIGGSIMLFVVLYYYHNFVKHEEKE